MRRAADGNKSGMEAIATAVCGTGRWLIDLALPPRCAGCGAIVDQLHSFCADSWRQIEWLGDGGCVTCGLPLEGTDVETCAACLARPPRIARTRAAVAYGDISRTLALRLKYSRKVAIAKTMARYMRPFAEALPENALLIPVPLHRSRLWFRGFNQAVLVASELSSLVGVPLERNLLRRVKRTVPLKGLGPRQRKEQVRGAFQVGDPRAVDGRVAVLIDDVLTTGSTAEACAKALTKAGASRVELICWARVVRPTQFMR